MRRFSQRNSLVTLSDINVTPMLDLAFVLLIIFILITPSIQPQREQGMKLNLPEGGQNDQQINPRDVARVSIGPRGTYMLGNKAIGLDPLVQSLIAARRANPRLIVHIRADEKGYVEHLYALIDRCQKNGIQDFSLRTEEAK